MIAEARVVAQVSVSDMMAMVATMGGDDEDLRKVLALETIFKRLRPNG